MTNEIAQTPSVMATMATRFGMDKRAFESTLMNTIMPQDRNGQGPSQEQVAAFLVVAKKYSLNPFTKEIFAFPAKGGGIQPIVSIDGWLKIINDHPQFDGMEFDDQHDDGRLVAVTCRIFRKDRTHPTTVTEYLSECIRSTEPWGKWPARMLRHKATIQAARYAFGFSGIVDPDEAERMESVGAITVTATVEPDEPAAYPTDKFDENLPKWQAAIEAGKSAEDIIAMVETKGSLTAAQKDTIRGVIEGEIVGDDHDHDQEQAA